MDPKDKKRAATLRKRQRAGETLGDEDVKWLDDYRSRVVFGRPPKTEQPIVDGGPPPPIDIGPVMPGARPPDVNKRSGIVDYQPGPIGSIFSKLMTDFIIQSNSNLLSRGGNPYPKPLIALSAISAAYLGDKYVGPYFGDDAVHFLNAGMPIGWILWEDHKLTRKEKARGNLYSIPDPPAEKQPTSDEPTVVTPVQPPPAEEVSASVQAAIGLERPPGL